METPPVLPRRKCPIIFSFFITTTANLSILLVGSNLTSKISVDFGSHIFMYSWNPMTKDLKFSSVFFIIEIWISIFCERFHDLFCLFYEKGILFYYIFTRTLQVLQWNSIIIVHCTTWSNSLCQFVYATAWKLYVYDKLVYILRLVFFFCFRWGSRDYRRNKHSLEGNNFANYPITNLAIYTMQMNSVYFIEHFWQKVCIRRAKNVAKVRIVTCMNKKSPCLL